MKENILGGKSQLGSFMFQKLLAWMDKPVRYKWGNPNELISAAGIRDGEKVLEIGCGSGFFTPAVAKIVGEKGRVEAIDIHPAAVEVTRRKIESLDIGNVRIRIADSHKTDYGDEEFDTVILYGVVPAPVISERRLGREVHRLLKPGGTLAVWTIAPFWTPKGLLKGAPFLSLGSKNKVHRLRKNKSGELA